MANNEILQDLFFIERGYLSGNHFVYRSKDPVLIDTGYISGFPQTEKILSRLDVNLSDVSLIINTHTHCDHIGGNHIIQQQSGCDIALHKVGKPFADMKKALSKSSKRIEYYLLHRDKIGEDLIKKIIVYTLLMKKRVREQTFFPYLMETHWFKETVDLYFNSEYEAKYTEIMNMFFKKGIIKQKNGDLYTAVKP
jgi:metal-dependent hydrolase (beta-lactamase superfamily II)